MWKSKIPWKEKLLKPENPEIKEAPEKWKKQGERMLIPTPMIIKEVVEQISEKKLLTTNSLRKFLAKNNNADFTCPLTTGIFLKIVAYAAEEARAEGQKNITPYWRVIKDDGSLPGLTDEVLQQQKLLEEEGFVLIPKGKKIKVWNFNAFLFQV